MNSNLKIMLFWIPAVIILTIQLFVQPVVGLADNNDFQRIMGWANLEYPNNNGVYFDYISGKYDIGHFPTVSSYKSYSSMAIIIKTGVSISKLITGGHSFDIRIMGFIFSILLLASYLLFLKACQKLPHGNFLAFAGLFIFFDISYTSHFNSFYEESVSYVFLFLTLACILYGLAENRFSTPLLVCLAVSEMFFISAKTQNGICGLLLAFYSVRLLTRFGYRKLSYGFAALMTVTALLTILTPPLKQANLYNSVFTAVLPSTASVDSDLSELGLSGPFSQQFAAAIGTNYFSNNPVHTPEVGSTFYQNVGFGKIMLFYLKHPGRLLYNIDIASKKAFIIRQDYLGNYERSSHKPPKSKSHVFDLWDKTKQVLFPKSIWFILGFMLMFLIAAGSVYKREESDNIKLIIEFLFVLAVMAVGQLFECVIGDGQFGIEKHLFLFDLIFDILFVMLLWSVLYKLKQKVVH